MESQMFCRLRYPVAITILLILIPISNSQQQCLCEYRMIGDGKCDEDCNTEACAYDFGDCGYTEDSNFGQIKSNKELFKQSLSYFVQFQIDKDLTENKKRVPGNTVVAFAAVGFGLWFVIVLICLIVLRSIKVNENQDEQSFSGESNQIGIFAKTSVNQVVQAQNQVAQPQINQNFQNSIQQSESQKIKENAPIAESNKNIHYQQKQQQPFQHEEANHS